MNGLLFFSFLLLILHNFSLVGVMGGFGLGKSVIHAEDATDTKWIENIKSQYNNILDPFFSQTLDTLEAQREIAPFLYRKNKEEFKEIQNLISNISIETGFDRAKEDKIKEQLHECLQLKMRDGLDKLLDTKGVTAENVEDFFHASRTTCNVTQGSDKVCYDMIRTFKKELRNEIKKLKIIDKARTKINKVDQKEQKEAFLNQLREQIILGAYPRK